MKVLLLGEYSGLHDNLKDGLLELGHDVLLASSGDGWKNIKSDLTFGYNGQRLIDKFSRIMAHFANLRSYIGYDVVQLISPVIFNIHISPLLLEIILKSKGNKKTFLLASGCDGIYFNNVSKLAYSPCHDCQQYDLSHHKCLWGGKRYKKLNHKVVSTVDGIIPIMYDYALGYRNFINVKDTIPIPINTNKFKYKENVSRPKLSILHGINREGFKGTKIIVKALEIIKNRYPNDVEITINGKMNLSKYLETVERVNIVVDQCFSYSYGLNALYSMALGKVVLSGCEKECLNEFKIRDCPIINIEPSVDDIVNKIEGILNNRKSVSEIGFESRKFVEEFHNHVGIAQKYVDTWEKSGNPLNHLA